MDQERPTFFVLSVAPGGVRGMIPAKILEEIEDKTGLPAAKLFGLMGTTSSGGITVSLLNVPDPNNPDQPLYKASDVVGFFRKFTSAIFPKSTAGTLRQAFQEAKYDEKPFEDILEKILGDTRINQAVTNLLFGATSINKRRNAVWIKHDKKAKDTSEEAWTTMRLRDLVRAITTAPFYFRARYVETFPEGKPPEKHALIDGGFFSGNSLHRLYRQAKRMAPPDARIVMVHIGTGSPHTPMEPEHFNRRGIVGLLDKVKATLMSSLLFNAPLADAVEEMKEELGKNFFVFDATIDRDRNPGDPSPSLDDGSKENVAKLEKFAERIIKDEKKEMDRFVDLVKDSIGYKPSLQDKIKGAVRDVAEGINDAAQGVKNAARDAARILTEPFKAIAAPPTPQPPAPPANDDKASPPAKNDNAPVPPPPADKQGKPPGSGGPG